MADVTQNISAQLFVKELPGALRADFNGCKQDFNSVHYTTCDNYIESDNAVENAFQNQLNLSEYYKSPYVFDTMKRSYMEKTMDSHFETEDVNLKPSPKTMPPELSSAQQNTPVGPTDFMKGGIKNSGIFKETFGAMNNSSCPLWLIIVIIFVIIFCCKK